MTQNVMKASLCHMTSVETGRWDGMMGGQGTSGKQGDRWGGGGGGAGRGTEGQVREQGGQVGGTGGQVGGGDR